MLWTELANFEFSRVTLLECFNLETRLLINLSLDLSNANKRLNVIDRQKKWWTREVVQLFFNIKIEWKNSVNSTNEKIRLVKVLNTQKSELYRQHLDFLERENFPSFQIVACKREMEKFRTPVWTPVYSRKQLLVCAGTLCAPFKLAGIDPFS